MSAAGGGELVFRVASEDEAFALLGRALEGHIADEAPALVNFVNWPTIDVRLPETPINASISPTMMQAFIELQTTIYRAHSLLTANSGDLRGLSKAEKDRLEFRVQVREGSSDYFAELAKPLQAIGGDVVNKMSSGELLIAVLGIALLVAGVISWKAWLSNRAENRKREIEKEEKLALIDAQKALLGHDATKYDLLIKAMHASPYSAMSMRLLSPLATR